MFYHLLFFCLIGILLQYELPVSPDLLPVCLIHFRCMRDRHLLRCSKKKSMDNPCFPICELTNIF